MELESAVDIMSFYTSGAVKESKIDGCRRCRRDRLWRERAQLFFAPSYVIPRIRKVVSVSFFLNLGAQVEIIELEMATTGSSRYTNSYLRSEDNVKPANIGSYLDHAFDARIASVDNKSL